MRPYLSSAAAALGAHVSLLHADFTAFGDRSEVEGGPMVALVLDFEEPRHCVIYTNGVQDSGFFTSGPHLAVRWITAIPTGWRCFLVVVSI